MGEIGINKSVKPYNLSCYYACCFPDTHITLGCSSLCFALISTKGIQILSALCPCGKDKKHRTKATLGYRHSGLFDGDFFFTLKTKEKAQCNTEVLITLRLVRLVVIDVFLSKHT